MCRRLPACSWSRLYGKTADLSKSLRVLDLCASPGGKSTLVQSLISKDSILVSNEVIKARVNSLQENIVKWGAANVMITNNDPAGFLKLENYFDLVIADAPCSGSGLFRREPEAVNEWSERNVQLCSHRQQRILTDIWPALKQDGILVYSTCSYSKEENEDILDWLAEEFAVDSLQLTVDSNWGIVETISPKNNFFGYRLYPDKIKGEGFFIAVLQKKDGGHFRNPKIKKTTAILLTNKETALATPWVNETGDVSFFKHNDLIHAIPEHILEEIPILQSSLYLKKAGVLLGQLTPKELIPDHELALSVLLHPGTASIQLSKEDAIQYLRKEEITVNTTHKGWASAQYENQNLGWVKILPNRINNYYPKEWRILKRNDELM